MNFIITRIVNKKESCISWRVHPVGDFYKTLLIIKQQDLHDLLVQITYQDIATKIFLEYLLKE